MDTDQKIYNDVLKEIADACSLLNTFEKRGTDKTYFEVVLYNKEIDKWVKTISGFLGTAVKPPSAKPTKDDQRITKDLGGIFANQTLFRRDFDNAAIIAMLWPWSDGAHTTLKIALLKK